MGRSCGVNGRQQIGREQMPRKWKEKELRETEIVMRAQQTHDVQATLPFGHDLVMSPMTLHNGCDNVTSQRWVMTLKQRYDVTSS